MSNSKLQVNAILDEDIEKILRATKYYEDFVSGKFVCECCGQVINAKNLGIILPVVDDGKVSLKFYCESIECLDNYYNDK